MAIWKFASDGSGDSTFGNQGIVVDASTDHASSEGNAIAIDEPRGFLFVLGQVIRDGVPKVALWKYDLNGTSLISSGVPMRANTADTMPEGGYSLCVNPNTGDLYATGFRGTGAGLWKLNGSYLSHVWTDYSRRGEGRAILEMPGVGLLVVGFARDYKNPASDMTMWLFSTPGEQPKVYQSGLSGEDAGWAATRDPLGRVLIAGHHDGKMVAWRFASDLVADAAFHQGAGFVEFDESTVLESRGAAIACDGSGEQIYVAGFLRRNDGQMKDMALWRLDSFGNLDPTFGEGGVVTHHSAAAGAWDDIGRSLAFDLQGKILIAGESTAPSTDGIVSRDLAVWRYLP